METPLLLDNHSRPSCRSWYHGLLMVRYGISRRMRISCICIHLWGHAENGFIWHSPSMHDQHFMTSGYDQASAESHAPDAAKGHHLRPWCVNQQLFRRDGRSPSGLKLSLFFACGHLKSPVQMATLAGVSIPAVYLYSETREARVCLYRFFRGDDCGEGSLKDLWMSDPIRTAWDIRRCYLDDFFC